MQDASGEFAGVCTVQLEQPGKPVVVLDHELIRRLELTLRSVPRSALGVVLASASDRVFVAGADLKAFTELDDSQLERYLAFGSTVFGMLSAFPFPTVAAINGAALGGGLELAMHCDGLVAAPARSRDGQPPKPYPIGLPEAGLCICPGWGGTNLLPARMDESEAIRRTATGQVMNFDQASAAGLFDAVAPSQEHLIPAAKSWILEARSKGRLERDGAPLRWSGRPDKAPRVLAALESVRDDCMSTEHERAVIEAVDAGLSRGWQASLEVERRQLIRLRHTPAARDAIGAFFAKAPAKK